jgi:hypothetical protein
MGELTRGINKEDEDNEAQRVELMGIWRERWGWEECGCYGDSYLGTELVHVTHASKGGWVLASRNAA